MSATQVPIPAVDQDAERAVLGAILLYGEPRLVSRLQRQGLAADYFYWEGHRNVYAAAVSLAARRVGCDPITIHAEMDRLGTREKVTKGQLDEFTAYVPAAGNVDAYADRVIEQARWRRRMTHLQEMVQAVEDRDEEYWRKCVAPFRPAPAQAATNGSTVLRLVDESGEVVGEQRHCDSCDKLKDQLEGAQTEIAGWRARCADLKRDKEKEARTNALWLPAQALFKHWQEQTGHKRSKWTASRFFASEPLLRIYGVGVFERAIAGLAYNPYTKLRRNGTTQRYDSWETLCKSPGAFEEYANRAPKGWKVTLRISVEAEDEAPALVAVP